MEVQCGQLIDDDAHRHILSLPGIDTCHETVEDKGVEGTDDALHLRVVRNEQVAGMLRIADLQVEVIAFLAEYPIRLLCGQSGREHTQGANHTLQLLHSPVVKGRAERTEQWSHLGVGHQYLEDGIIALVEEREDMRHVAVLAQPIGRLTDIALGITDDTCRLDHPRLRVNSLVVGQLPALLVIGPLLIIAEEVDARGEEVDSGSLEELVAAASTLFLAFLQ